MRHGCIGSTASLTVFALLAASNALAGGPNLEILSHSPAMNALSVPNNAVIEIDFDRAVQPSSFASTPFRFHVYAERSGTVPGVLTFLNAGTRVRFTPTAPFLAGERVWVTMARDVAGADASTLGPKGYAWQFWAKSQSASNAFSQVDILDTTQPGISPRPYGGQACDFNRDGSVDICIVNEDTSDLRVFLNNPALPGQFASFIQPTAPTGPVPSPNESADFNGDGLADMCTANTASSLVSVLFGNGDGTFQPRTDYACGAGPHGIAVLDADGDGDIDIATANTDSSNASLLLNNGNGSFASPIFFEGGGSGEWAINAADMNNDGVQDLVVGARSSGTITVHLNNGAGVFTPAATLNTGLQYWMIVCSDVNGDGNMDVTCAASGSGGVIHTGNGVGGLGAPQVFNVNGMIATDTGDLDGDGDLDWVLSSFQGGQWYVLRNDAGAFSLQQVFPASSNPACALILDFNKDGALDVAMIDEISDEVFLLQNTLIPPAPCFGDANRDGVVTFADITSVLATFGTSYLPGTGVGDADYDGTVNFADITSVLANFGMPCP